MAACGLHQGSDGKVQRDISEGSVRLLLCAVVSLRPTGLHRRGEEQGLRAVWFVMYVCMGGSDLLIACLFRWFNDH